MADKDQKKRLKFNIASENIRIKNLLGQELLAVEIKCISSINPNRNMSWFTPQGMVESLESFKNKPILCHYIPNEDDFGAHDFYRTQKDFETGIEYEDYSRDSEVAIGVIPESSNVIFYHDDEDGLDWIKCDAILWTHYNYKAIKRLLKSNGTSISVEVDVLDWEDDEREVEVIKKFSLLGITMLSAKGKYNPAIPNAEMTIDYDKLYNSRSFCEQTNAIKKAYAKFFMDSDINWKDPVINEVPKDEIQFDEDKKSKEKTLDKSKEDKKEVNDTQQISKKGESFSMTYEGKINILSIALRDVFKDVWVYIVDLDETYVYYVTTDNDTTFKAPYQMHEGGAYIDVDKREKVTRSWQSYSEMDKDKNKKEFDVLDPNGLRANVIAHINHDDEKAGIDLHMSEDEKKETEAKDENKEECSDTSKEECAEKDDSKEDSKDSKTEKEDCDCDDDKEEKESVKEECAKEECASEDKECKMSDEEKCASEEKCAEDGDKSEEKCASKEECTENDSKDSKTEKEQSTVQQPPIISQDTYAKLEAKFAALEKEHNELKAKFTERVNNDLLKFAQTFVGAESELNSDSAKAVFTTVESEIKANKFSTCEEVEKFATTEIATALYAQKKANKVDKKAEFSYNVNRESTSYNIMGSSSDAEELKARKEKLKYV